MGNYNYDEILSKPEFRSMEPERVKHLKDVMSKLEGKGQMESITIIMDAFRKMPKGKEFTKLEQDAMVNAFLSKLEPQEKEKYQMLVGMIRNQKQ